ncbi:MAG: DUF2490 domain-containing protein [Bacteroidales bacterium]|nr:DUF2490 domain-containing protein [Bacteroidales bacterium]
MKKIFATVLVLAALMPAALAQGTKNDMESDFRGRLSAGIDKKISKGFHLDVEGEVRFTDNFGEVGRYQLGAGLSYKIAPWLKAGLGYLYIGNKGSSGSFSPRHRGYFDLTESLASGDWKFSLRERILLTHRGGDFNKFQSTPNALALKTRFKAQYKGFANVSPYAIAELKIQLNDPACKGTWNGTEYTSYEFKGYDDCYLTRIRGGLGAEWKLSKQHALDFYLLADYIYSKEIDTNKAGTKLKSLTYDQTFATTIGVAYKFSF